MTRSIIFGGGCFWCTEAAFQLVDGVESVEPGYAGGATSNPTYYQVVSGDSGHAEVVRVTYDPARVSLDRLLEVFFRIHDPTTLNRQGADVGTQYRSLILYSDQAERAVIDAAIEQAAEKFNDPIVTEVRQDTVFYPAEPEHVNFYRNNPENRYCQIVIAPKIAKLTQSDE